MRKPSRVPRQNARKLARLKLKRRLPKLILSTAIAFFLPKVANAAVLLWDQDGMDLNNTSAGGAGTGGTNFWNTSSPAWYTGGNFQTGSYGNWNNASGDTALFWGTAGTVTLGEAITAGGLQFNTTGYTINTGGRTLSLTGAAAITLNTVATASPTTGMTQTINGSLSGAGSVVFNGGVLGGIVTNTMTFTGTSTTGWTGATTINNGINVNLAGANQALVGTSGLTLNGGTLTLTNINNTEGALNRVNNSASIASNGGTIAYTNTATGTAYAETLGSVTLNSGQLNIVPTNAVTSGTQILTLGGLGKPAASATSAVTFGAGGGLNTGTNQVKVTGATATPAGQIIAPWATVGTTAAAQTDYAIYNGTTNVVPANIATSAQTAWTNAANAYTNTTSATTTLTGSRTITALRYSNASAGTLALAGFNLETFGILNGAAGTLTISGAGAVRQQGTDPANLYLTTGAGAITVSAAITDNTGALTLVKSGTTGTLTLTGANSYTGGTVINAGTISINANTALGDTAINAPLTFDGNGQLTVTAGSPISRPITINNGAIATFANGAVAVNLSGNITGTGGINSNQTTGALTLSGAANTFTGPVIVTAGTLTLGTTGALGNTANPVNIANAASAILNLNGRNTTVGSISGGGTTGGTINLTSATLTVGGNQESTTYAGVITGTGSLVKNGNGTLALTGNSSFEGGATLNSGYLAVNTSASLGASSSPLFFEGGTLQWLPNTFTNPQDISAHLLVFSSTAALDTNGTVAALSQSVGDGASGGLSKLGNGTLILGGANSYQGATTIHAGVLRITNGDALGSADVGTTVNAGTSLVLQGNLTTPAGESITLGGAGHYTQSGALVSEGAVIIGGGITLAGSSTISADSGTLSLGSTDAITGAGFSLTLAGAGSGVLNGAVQTGSGSLVKNGSGTWTLTGAGNHTGGTFVNGGTLIANLDSSVTGVLGNTSALTLTGNGNLRIVGSGTGAAEQTLGALTLGDGSQSSITVSDPNALGTTLKLDGGVWNRGLGSTLLFDYLNSGSGASVLGVPTGTGGATGVNNVLGYALVRDHLGNVGLASIDGNQIVALDSGSLQPLADNTDDGVGPFKDYTTAGMAANPLAWTNGVTNRAVNSLTFDASAADQTVNMGAASNVLTLESGAIVVQGGNNSTLTGGQVGAAGSEVIVHQLGSGTFEIASKLSSGSGSYIQNGTGTVLLSGANTYTGPTRINGGTVRAGSASALGSNSAVIISTTAPAVLDTNGFNLTIGSLAGGGSVVLSDGKTLYVGGPNEIGNLSNVNTRTRYDGLISGSGNLTLTGGGVLTLTNNGNTYTGQTNINGGTLVVSNMGQLGLGTSPIFVNGLASTQGLPGGALVLQGGLGGMSIDRDISVAGRGSNTVGLSFLNIGNNTYNGTFIANGAGESRVGSSFGTMTFSAQSTFFAGADQRFYILAGPGNIVIDGLIIGGSTGPGIHKSATNLNNTLVVTNQNNAYIGDWRVDSGTVRFSHGDQMGRGTSSTQLRGTGGSFEIRTDAVNSFTTKNANGIDTGFGIFLDRAVGGTGLGTQTISAEGLPQYASANGNVIFNELLIGTGGSRTITFTGRNGYGSSWHGGADGLLNTATAGSPQVVNSSNGVISLDGSVAVSSDGTARTFTFNSQGDSVLTGYILQGAGAGRTVFTKSGAGTLAMTGTNTTAGLTSTYNMSTNVTGTLLLSGASATIGNASGGLLNGVAGGALQLNSGALDYRGSGETTAKTISLTGTTGNGILLANQSGATPLIFNTSAVGAGGVGAKTFYLGGHSPSTTINEIGGVINNSFNTGGTASATNLAKVGTNTWLYSPDASTSVPARVRSPRPRARRIRIPSPSQTPRGSSSAPRSSLAEPTYRSVPL